MEFLEPLLIVVEAFESAEVPYMLVGSVAAVLYSVPRFTNDVDIVAELRDEHIALLRPRFDDDDWHFDPEQIRAAIRSGGQFNLVHFATGVKIDLLSVPSTSYGRTEFERRRPVAVTGERQAMLAGPEDVILMKLVYYREGRSDKHLSDCAAIVKSRGEELDRRYIELWAGTLQVESAWQAVLARIAESE